MTQIAALTESSVQYPHLLSVGVLHRLKQEID